MLNPEYLLKFIDLIRHKNKDAGVKPASLLIILAFIFRIPL